MAITVALIDDHAVVLAGLRGWLSDYPGSRFQVVHASHTLEHADNVEADVFVIDLMLADGSAMEGIGTLAASGRRVLVFSGNLDQTAIARLYDLGVCAYLEKGRAEFDRHLVEAIESVAADRPYVTPTDAGVIMSDQRASLSEQETIALSYWFQGMSKQAVGRRMGISEHTVRQYINRARVKYANLGRPAPTKEQLMARALEDGLLDLGELALYRSRAAREGGS